MIENPKEYLFNVDYIVNELQYYAMNEFFVM